jgi:lipoprotein-anchoring transpeptidase ErfK/SrfK
MRSVMNLRIPAMVLVSVAFAAVVQHGALAAGTTELGSSSSTAAHPVVATSIAGASAYRTPAQELIAGLVAAGEQDIEELVQFIIADNREVLDHIVINLAEQRLYECNANGEVLRSTPTSTGRRGYETPTGEYRVVNKAPKAYSEKYEAWMLHWLGLTRDGGYGIHGLEGSSYERLLGRVASHGCIRVSRDFAREAYSRVSIGTPVTIVNDPSLSLPPYEPLSERAATALVLEVISPANPWEIFY